MGVLDFLSIGVSGLSLIVSICSYRASVKLERKKATIEAIGKLQNEAIDKLNLYTKKEIAEIAQNERSAEYKAVSSLLGRVEHFAVGVNNKVYDEDIANKLAGELLVPLYSKLLPVIQKKRTHNKNVYDDFEKLACRLERYRK